MGTVATGFSMSLDGFVAGPNDDEKLLFAWMFKGSGDLTLTTGDHDIPLKIDDESAKMFADAMNSNGALIAGRRLFDITNGWGGKHPMNIPIVVVTHNVPQEWANDGSPFTFVTNGVESAINKAKQIAGDKNVVIASTTIVQQAIKLGLLDDIHIDLVPVILGEGVRLFDQLGLTELELEITNVAQAPGVLHLDFHVIK